MIVPLWEEIFAGHVHVLNEISQTIYMKAAVSSGMIIFMSRTAITRHRVSACNICEDTELMVMHECESKRWTA